MQIYCTAILSVSYFIWFLREYNWIYLGTYCTPEKLNYNQSDQQAIKTVFAAKCYFAMTQKWYYPTIPQTFMYDDNGYNNCSFNRTLTKQPKTTTKLVSTFTNLGICV